MDRATYDQLDRIEAKLNAILEQGATMSVELDTLAAQVKANTDAEKSAVLLIQGIAAQLTTLNGDKAKELQLAADLKASGDTLAAAVTANTPHEP